MKTVAIVGTNSRSRGLAPWNDNDVDIWVFNETPGIDKKDHWLKRWDLCFQMHKPAIFRNPKNRNDPNHYAWLKKEHAGKCIMMQEHYDEIPASKAYPLEDICSMLLCNLTVNDAKVKFFTSSVAYAIALAIYQQYDKIEIYGVGMESETEYAYQREGVLFWIAQAIARGIQVDIPGNMPLFKELLYGYEGDTVIGRQEFEAAMNHWNNEAQQTQIALTRAAAKVEAVLAEMRRVDNDAEAKVIGKKYHTVLEEYNNAVFQHGLARGAMAENMRYMDRVDALIKAAGNSEDVVGNLDGAISDETLAELHEQTESILKSE